MPGIPEWDWGKDAGQGVLNLIPGIEGVDYRCGIFVEIAGGECGVALAGPAFVRVLAGEVAYPLR